jgi:hypothetical protein
LGREENRSGIAVLVKIHESHAVEAQLYFTSTMT